MKAARNPLAFRRLPCSFSRQQRSDHVVIQDDSPPVVPVLQSLKLSYANRGQKRGLPTKARVKHSKVEDSPDTTSVLSFPPPPESTEEDIDWSKLVHSAPSSPARISPQPHVRFTPVDSVVEIPSHRDYTALEKRSIWTSLHVLRNQAKRNRIEWFWEGCDVEGVVEEDAFSYDSQGCLKHPAHFEAKKTKRRRI
ncbi:hypothetical protein FisN_11Hu271 [Fistulifera solaris]|uniref:Uncharacterized protein n=1 Tax=Fistulifera solaris TaxID=1519565 RepID=A0A1Z5JLR6_FISSO|nr:hypothetical protein FisN_11Hu271 [Fistulifera solaris]|eukprot:GAX14728.1 hypothetical protein FisN_11Hu271 [Fistulifera solaris]